MSARIGCYPLVLAAALLAGPAAAQTAPAAASPAAATAPAPSHPMVEKRISGLRSKLKITPEQNKAFEDFAQVVRDNASRMDVLVKERTANTAAMTAVDQMKAYEAMAQGHADDMQRLVPAFSRLYDALSPEQKKAADQSFREYGMAGQKHA